MLIGLSIAFVILLSITLYIYFKRKKYTKEIFIFWSANAYITFSLTTMVFITSGHQIIFNLNKEISLQIGFNEVQYITQIILFLILISVYKLFQSYIKNWDGAISTRTQEKQINKEEESKIKDYIVGLLSVIKQKELTTFNQNQKDREITGQNRLLQNQEIKKLLWHEKVAKLLSLKDSQYNISLDNDWIEEKKFFISKYWHQEIAIFCKSSLNSTVEIKKALEEALSFNPNIKKFYIATEKLLDLKFQTTDKVEIIYLNEESLIKDILRKSNFEAYFNNIIERYETKEITQGKEITLSKIFTAPSGKNHEKNIDNLETYILDWLDDNSTRKHLALLGEYGQGKSALSLKIAYELIKTKHKRIPILIELRGTTPRTMTPHKILGILADEYRHMDNHFIQYLVEEGKALLILEGFDEMDLVGDKNKRLAHFESLWKLSFPKSKILITGRPNLFFDTDEMPRALGFTTNIETARYCEPIYIDLFSNAHIKNFLRNIESTTSQEIIETINNSSKNQSFLELISRPSTLYLTTIIWHRIKKELSKNHSLSSSSVIKEFINDSYERQRVKETQEGMDPILTVEERDYFMHGIAVGLVKTTQYTNKINKDELKKIILNLYTEIPKDINDATSAMYCLREPLKKRLKDSEFEKDSIITDVIACGLLVKDHSEKDTFKFAHKSFLEYLFANCIYLYLEEKQSKSFINSISKSLNIKNITSLSTNQETIKIINQLLFKVKTEEDNSFSYDESLNFLKEIDKYLFYISRFRILTLSLLETLGAMLIFYICLFSYNELTTLSSSLFSVFNISINYNPIAGVICTFLLLQISFSLFINLKVRHKTNYLNILGFVDANDFLVNVKRISFSTTHSHKQYLNLVRLNNPNNSFTAIWRGIIQLF